MNPTSPPKNHRLRRALLLGLAAMAFMACNFPGYAVRRPTPSPSPTQAPTSTPPDTASLQTPTFHSGQATATLAPQPTKTVTPLSGAACLPGTWAITNLETTISGVIPTETVHSYDLKYQETRGSARLVFLPGSRISLQASQLELVFTARVTILRVPLVAAINGQANGTYQVEGQTLTTQAMDTSGLSANIRLAGRDLVDPAQLMASLPLLQPPFNTASFTCEGDSLQMTVKGYSRLLTPLIFQRLR